MVTGRYERWLERHSLERVRRLAEEGYTLAEIAAELDTDEKRAAFVKSYDWERMTRQDEGVWNKIIEFIEG